MCDMIVCVMRVCVHISLTSSVRRCRERDLRDGGYFIPYQNDAVLRESSLWNDVRPRGSPALVWYFKATLRYEVATHEASKRLLPIRQWTIAHPFVGSSADQTLARATGLERRL